MQAQSPTRYGNFNLICFIHLVLIFAFHSDGPFSSDDDDGGGDGGGGGGSSVGYSHSNQFDLDLDNDLADGLFGNTS